MGESKHTQGPWVIQEQAIISADGNTHIAYYGIAKKNHSMFALLGEEKANAELIASAPTMLSDLTTLRQENERLRKVLEEIIKLEQPWTTIGCERWIEKINLIAKQALKQ